MRPIQLIACSMVSAAVASAQTPARQSGPPTIEQNPIIGVRVANRWFVDSAVTRVCPPFVRADTLVPDATRDGPALRRWCTVDTSYALPHADFTQWMTVAYLNFAVYAADSTRRALLGATRDTVVLATAVLYTFRDHALAWGPEWLGTVSREITWSVHVESAAQPDQSMLVGIRYCINGTGGCWQRYLRRRSGQWTPIEERFWSQIPPIRDGRIGKGIGIDVTTLTGSYGVYGDADGNCCPSREILLRLALRGDTLALANHEIRAAR